MAVHSEVRRVAEFHHLEVLSARLVDHSFPLHFHDTFVVEWVTSGSDYCATSQATAHRGQLFVHGPGVPHEGAAETLEYRACYPTPELVAQLLGTELDQLPRVGTRVLDSRPVRKAAEQLFARLETNRISGLEDDLTEVLCLALDGSDQPRSSAANSSAPAVLRARDYLIEHLDRTVSSAELAQVAGLSRFHLIREFKRVLQITPRQFTISRRVSQARALIAAGHPLAEVAHATGFADQSHLTRQFKRVTAFNPGQLRAARA